MVTDIGTFIPTLAEQVLGEVEPEAANDAAADDD